jgi:hypothetical protein
VTGLPLCWLGSCACNMPDRETPADTIAIVIRLVIWIRSF